MGKKKIVATKAKKPTISSITTSTTQLKYAKPSDFVVENDFNLRSVRNVENDLALMNSIIQHGFMDNKPLLASFENGKLVVRDGHRRLSQVLAANDLKAGTVEQIPFILEKNDDASDRIARMILSNDGEPLTPMDEAEGFKRMKELGEDVSNADIAVKLGKTESFVRFRLEMLNLPAQVKKYFERGQITLTGLKELGREFAKNKDKKAIVEKAALVASASKPTPGQEKVAKKLTKETGEKVEASARKQTHPFPVLEQMEAFIVQQLQNTDENTKVLNPDWWKGMLAGVRVAMRKKDLKGFDDYLEQLKVDAQLAKEKAKKAAADAKQAELDTVKAKRDEAKAASKATKKVVKKKIVRKIKPRKTVKTMVPKTN